MASAQRPTGFLRVLLGLLKTAAVLIGLPLTVLALMALVGLATANGWARIIVALVVAIGLPLFLVDRLLPDSNLEKARGLPTDLLALFWAGFACIFFGAGHGFTAEITAREADRLAASNYSRLARAGYYLASVVPQATASSGDSATPAPADADSKPASPKRSKPSTKSEGKAVAGKDAPKSPEKMPEKSPEKKPEKSADAAAGGKKAAKKKRRLYTPQELFATFAPAVVSIQGESGSGTGFVIDDIGTIATNHHVIDKQNSLKVKLQTGEWLKKVEILSENKERDLALLRVKTSKKLPSTTLGDSNNIKVGERVLAVGNPLGLDHTLTDGVVSSRRVLQGKKWVQTSTPVSPGNSGGPLFNLHGEVVAVVTAQFGGMFGRAQNLNLAVPVNELKAMIKDDYPNRRMAGTDASGTW